MELGSEYVLDLIAGSLDQHLTSLQYGGQLITLSFRILDTIPFQRACNWTHTVVYILDCKVIESLDSSEILQQLLLDVLHRYGVPVASACRSERVRNFLTLQLTASLRIETYAVPNLPWYLAVISWWRKLHWEKRICRFYLEDVPTTAAVQKEVL